jgi:hypothetical protein
MDADDYISMYVQMVSCGAGAATSTDAQNFTSLSAYKLATPQSLAMVDYVGTDAVGVNKLQSATINCDAGSAITSQDGSWIASVGNISTGVCSITITTSKFNSAPRCWAEIKGSNLDEKAKADGTSATNINLYGVKPSDGSALTSFDAEVFCKGNR